MAEVKLEDAPQGVRIYYDKGVAAMERDNLEYAMDMFEAALAIEPRLLQLRKLLRAASVKKAKSNPPGKLSIAKGLSGLMKASSLNRKNPLQALEIAEKLLRIDPFSLKFSKTLCAAAESAELPEVAIQTLEILRDTKSGNLAVLEPLARLYSETEQFEREYECRSIITKLKPNDTHALKELKDAAARLTMGKAGWQKAESFRDMVREDIPHADQANELEKLRNNVEQDPKNLNIRRDLAEFLLLNKLYSEAIQTLEKYQELAGSPDPQIDRKLLLAREHQIDLDISRADDANDREHVSELRKNLSLMRFEYAAKQAERYPNDLQLKFDYGKLLIENESHTEAIQQFQLAQRNPQRRIQSLIYLARAFKAKGQLDIAREQLESALTELHVMDESKKEVLYELGLLCETAGDNAKAENYLKKIYSVDIGYRDVAARIEKSTGK
ncbi:MAG: tetratricopeptide repeat protein [Pontiella sp.]